MGIRLFLGEYKEKALAVARKYSLREGKLKRRNEGKHKYFCVCICFFVVFLRLSPIYGYKWVDLVVCGCNNVGVKGNLADTMPEYLRVALFFCHSLREGKAKQLREGKAGKGM